MFRIDNASATASLPSPAAPGTAGFWTNGNPGTGAPPTIIDADWMNRIQEELMTIVLAQAAITPSKTNNTQVAEAILSGILTYALDTGTANTYVASLGVAPVSLTQGMEVNIKIAHTNTGASTLNLNTQGAESITYKGAVLSGGELVAGQITTFVYDLATTTWQLISVSNMSDTVQGQCYFQTSSTTVAQLTAFRGNRVSFPSGAKCVLTVGSPITSNITSCFLNGTGSSALSANTQYYAYLALISGSYVIDWSTTGHVTDPTGIEVKSGDNTRVLVGSAYINGSSQLSDGDGARLFLSWFNRQPKRSRTTFTTGRATASTSFVELNTEIRNSFITWASPALVEYTITGGVSNSSTQTAVTGIAFDGTTLETEASNLGVSGSTNSNGPVALHGNKTGLSETTIHYATLMAAVNAGTSTWDAANTNSSGTVAINLVIQG